MGLFNTLTTVARYAYEEHKDYKARCELEELNKKIAARNKLEEAAKLGDADAMWELVRYYEREGDEIVEKGNVYLTSEERRDLAKDLEDAAAERFRWQLRAAKTGHPEALKCFKTLDPKTVFVIYEYPELRDIGGCGQLDVERLKKIVFDLAQGELSVSNPEDIAFDTKLGSWHANIDAYAIHVPLGETFETFRDFCIFMAKKLSCSFTTHSYAKPNKGSSEHGEKPVGKKPASAKELSQVPGTLCPVCGHSASSKAKFCSECGAPLLEKCSSCGTKLDPTMKFCPECGAKVGRDQPSVSENAKPESTEEESLDQTDSTILDDVRENLAQPQRERDDITDANNIEEDIEDVEQADGDKGAFAPQTETSPEDSPADDVQTDEHELADGTAEAAVSISDERNANLELEKENVEKANSVSGKAHVDSPNYVVDKKIRIGNKTYVAKKPPNHQNITKERADTPIIQSGIVKEQQVPAIGGAKEDEQRKDDEGTYASRFILAFVIIGVIMLVVHILDLVFS